jgi:SNF2 family DNA or RNA helicase
MRRYDSFNLHSTLEYPGASGVGLNLTRANNVIFLDLGWSQAIESQAYDRVHRLGQTRDVHVQRVVIADTVEDRILTMQERKVWNFLL